jgi:hypothetical protein
MNILIIIFITLACFSLLGSLTIIIFYFNYKKLRSFVFSLVFFLSISEFIYSANLLLSIDLLFDNPKNQSRHIVCWTQSILMTFFDINTLIWIIIISYTINDLMINYNQEINKKKKLFIYISYSIPTVFTIV